MRLYFLSPSGREWFVSLVLLTFLFAFDASLIAAPSIPHERDLEIIDRLLAGVKPGQTVVRCGDFGLTPAQLRIIRERLVTPMAQRPGEPDAATPPGIAFKWPGGNIPYQFDANVSAEKRQQFRDSVAEWAAWANLHFIESIAGQTDFITVRENPSGGGGYSSSVGRGGGEQFIEFGPNAWNRGTICHEMGHALGFFHEHQRSDRDNYVTIHFENVIPGAEANFTPISGGTVNQGAYDFYSVMHYARNTLSTDPNDLDPAVSDTIELKTGYTQFTNIIGRVTDRTLSKLDRAGIAQVYGNPSPLPNAVVTNTKESGPGSLGTALYFAFDRSTNTPASPTTITFQIPTADPGFDGNVFTIRPTYGLVSPGAGTTIDGATQTALGNTNPDGPEIVLDGSQLTAQGLLASSPGLLLREANCTVRNLVINGFNLQGISIVGPATAGSVVTGCYIGTDKTGTIGMPNGYSGIEIHGGAHGNTIGGTAAAARNVISGNNFSGIAVYDSGTTGNIILGNFIGTNANGTGALSNLDSGVILSAGAHDNVIGGTVSGARNVISGNRLEGVVLAGSSTTGNTVLGNFIGTNAAGAASLANGIFDSANDIYFPGMNIVNGAHSNTVGGTAVGAGNLISGNAAEGIRIADSGSDSNVVQGNLIGTHISGTSAIANNFAGLGIFGGAKFNQIGGSGPRARNVISGNNAQGVAIFYSGTSNNQVLGNYIGTNVSGTAALANLTAGVDIFDASLNQIGGLAGARNLISGNSGTGVIISGAGAVGNKVQGNTIGRNPANSGAIPNGSSGIALFNGATSNLIGSVAPGLSNLISGNSSEGIYIGDPSTIRNSIFGNSISDNGSPGIVLFNGGNLGQPAPALTAASLDTATHVQGSLTAGANSTHRIEFFSSPTADPFGFGEGRTFLGFLDLALGGSGTAGFNTALPAVVPAGHVVSATATDSVGNTSAFSNAITITSFDSDGDGIPNAYETAHGLNPNANDAALDADGDGLTNAQEFRAGSDPQSGSSRFAITAVNRTASNLGVTFSSISGKTYRLEYKDSVLSTNWTLLSDQVFAIGSSTQIVDVSAVSPQRFYRVVLEP